MKKILNISLIFLLLINLSLLSIAQDLPVACAGSIERYRVQGSPNSDFNWEVTGGTIHRFYNDSIDIRWNSIAGTRTITVTEINIFGCEGQPYSQTLVVTAPFIDIGLDVVNICSGETHEFEAVVDDVESYLWQDNVSNGETFIASVSGEYWVKVTDSNGCVNADTADLVIHENPAVDLGPDTTLCGEGEQIDLDVSDVGGINYEWSNGSLSAYSSVYSSTSDQVVWVVVSDINGC